MNTPVREGVANCLERLNRNTGESRISKDMGIHSSSNFVIVADYGDIQFCEQKKDNGTKTLAFIYKSGRGDVWMAVIPTSNQVEILVTKLRAHFTKVNEENQKALGK